LPSRDIFVYPLTTASSGTSVDIENSVALRATPVKARSRWLGQFGSVPSRSFVQPKNQSRATINR
jgi:hypothetical protein